MLANQSPPLFAKMNIERLKKLKWPSLELRRKRLCLVQLYKIMFGLCDIDKFKYLDIVGESRTRSRHRYKLLSHT